MSEGECRLNQDAPPSQAISPRQVAVGENISFSDLTEDFYRQLRKQAEQYLQRRFGRAAGGLTWQPTVLLNETILRLIKRPRRYDSQGHMFALATTAMKHVLIDYVRQRRAQKRAGVRCRIEFDPELHSPASAIDSSQYDIEAVLKAISDLSEFSPRRGEVAWMRLIWSFSIRETAEALQVSGATIDRDWRFAQAWLRTELSSKGTGTSEEPPNALRL